MTFTARLALSIVALLPFQSVAWADNASFTACTKFVYRYDDQNKYHLDVIFTGLKDYVGNLLSLTFEEGLQAPVVKVTVNGDKKSIDLKVGAFQQDTLYHIYEREDSIEVSVEYYPNNDGSFLLRSYSFERQSKNECVGVD